MSTRVAIEHTIEQRFDRAVRMSTQWLRLRPAPQTRARICAYSFAVRTQPSFVNWMRDPFENHMARLDLPEPVTRLALQIELICELEPVNPFDLLVEPYAAQYPFAYPPQLQKELAPYLHMAEPGPGLAAWLSELQLSEGPTIARLEALNQRVRRARNTTADAEASHNDRHMARVGHADHADHADHTDHTDMEKVVTDGARSHWALAWLLTLSLRHAGLAARFVSGYRVSLLEVDEADEADAADRVNLHAWSEVYLPGAGWIGLDPDAGLFCTETYIPLASAAEPLRAQPIVGYVEACEETQLETLRVRRLVPRARGALLDPTQWQDVRALGAYVDADLAAQGLKPSLALSFSLVTQQAAVPEWQNLALGSSKRSMAETLLRGLQPRMAAGGVPHQGQGEWYAGETLPRWRLACYFRSDGQPLWRDPALLAESSQPGSATSSAARAFTEALAAILRIDARAVVPAYEDALHALWNARVAPAPAAGELEDPERRRALADRLSQAHDAPVGYVLPLRRDHVAGGWSSGGWTFRRDRLYVIAGESCLGYRLPLDSLSLETQDAIEAQLERDPFADPSPLHGLQPAAPAPAPVTDALPGRVPSTALCVEARAGHLHVFLPPLYDVAHYIELIAAVEAAARQCGQRVVLEGYEPPDDPRLRRILLEPEAGALRLTLPETHAWLDHVRDLQLAYAEAERIGLHTERVGYFDDDLRLSAGPSCVTVGGARPIDSPFLTRPEVLRALVAHWQRHPSLSYFFSGHVIGSSGSASRPDDGRDEALYELSIGLEHLPAADSGALWQVHRALRHLLSDPSGDAKRAEFRIDQLYPPERASRRMGRLGIQSFATAPDAQLASLQSLLVLGLLGRFARHPDALQLCRWGEALRDRFMLPAVLFSDLREVLEDLGAHGYPFQLAWFEPLLALRFPLLGSVQIGAITLALHPAHEAWTLLAEELTANGMARFIDSANERLQVSLSGLPPARYRLVCNGRPVPLQPLATDGEYVAGVRFKASNPPSTLHPTLPPVDALVFDLIDTWTGRVVGGCTYYPARPISTWPGQSTGTVSAPPPGGPRVQPQRLQAPPVSFVVQQRAGRFVPRGSGIARAVAPSAERDGRKPYLLDLTRPR